MAVAAVIPLDTIKRGDTYIIEFNYEDDDGYTDITNVDIAATARREIDGVAWFDLKPKKTDPLNGVFVIHLTSTETQQITESPPGSFSGLYDIQFSWPGANETFVATVCEGSISISKDVTYRSTI